MSESISRRLTILPALSEIAVRLLEQLSDRNTSQYEIIALIESEEGMAEQLLSITNRTMFGATRITTLPELIDLLGLPRLRSMILAFAVNRLFAESGAARGRTTGLSTKISWDHAISVAYLGVELARRIKYPRLEEVLLAGLVHDIGRFVMMLNIPSEYSEVLGEIYGETVNIAEIERQRLGFSHEQAGALLLMRWELSDALVAVANHHHSSEIETEHQFLVNIITLANQLAVLEGTSFERGEPLDPDRNIPLNFLKLSTADIELILTGYRGQITSFKSLFQS